MHDCTIVVLVMFCVQQTAREERNAEEASSFYEGHVATREHLDNVEPARKRVSRVPSFLRTVSSLVRDNGH